MSADFSLYSNFILALFFDFVNLFVQALHIAVQYALALRFDLLFFFIDEPIHLLSDLLAALVVVSLQLPLRIPQFVVELLPHI